MPIYEDDDGEEEVEVDEELIGKEKQKLQRNETKVSHLSQLRLN